MARSHMERMMKLADEVFASRFDPEQLDVNQEVLERLRAIHPSSVAEYNDGKGPVAWVLLIPTTNDIMRRFLCGDISERELFQLTQPGQCYEAIYLCSALVLEEYRRKGIVSRLALEAIASISRDHPVQSLYVWPFSREGDRCAEQIAMKAKHPLFKRVDHAK